METKRFNSNEAGIMTGEEHFFDKIILTYCGGFWDLPVWRILSLELADLASFLV
jgi:hypothetical protein